MGVKILRSYRRVSKTTRECFFNTGITKKGNSIEKRDIQSDIVYSKAIHANEKPLGDRSICNFDTRTKN